MNKVLQLFKDKEHTPSFWCSVSLHKPVDDNSNQLLGFWYAELNGTVWQGESWGFSSGTKTWHFSEMINIQNFNEKQLEELCEVLYKKVLQNQLKKLNEDLTKLAVCKNILEDLGALE